jgi:hypothetical protein
MTYTPNVPQATQTIAFTQPLIQGNFSYIDVAMKVDHAWNGNEINSQADGSHQKISLPNQPVDITGALPTGISAIMYAIGGNIFSWNGAKGPVSAVSGSGTFAMTGVFQTIVSVPNNCIGFLVISGPSPGFTAIGSMFFSLGGVLHAPPLQNFSPIIIMSYAAASLNLQVHANIVYNADYKFIYWPI